MLSRRLLLARAAQLAAMGSLPVCGGAQAASADAPDYAPVLPGRVLRFPADHAAHPDFRTEWWYITGALDAPHEHIGFQFTLFRSRLIAPDWTPEQRANPLALQQLMFAHGAVSDARRGKILHAERAARVPLGAGFSLTDCDHFIGNWRIWREDAQPAGQSERFRIQVRDPQLAFDLTLALTQPRMLQGQGGYSQKGPDPRLSSYYVSLPQLAVSGTIRLPDATNSAPPIAARGRAWFDQEWSSEVLGDTGVGWDWIGINLDDGGSLMAFQIRDAAGRAVYAHAALRDAAGRMTQYGADEVRFEPLRYWVSPRHGQGGARYPVAQRITFGPHRIETAPVMDDQELITQRLGRVAYWEGLSRVSGTLQGRGYLEMTGYAGRLNL
jgi:predicted secreted hydrolase